MLKTIFHFENNDSTLDLNTQLSQFFQKGIISGGEITPVTGQLKVQIAPFKLIGQDGMVVMETSNTTLVPSTGALAVGLNYIYFNSQYNPSGNPTAQFEVSLTPVSGRVLFGTALVTLGDTQVASANIDLSTNDQIDAVKRLVVRAVLSSTSQLPVNPTSKNIHVGDSYVVTSGSGDSPAIYCWNGLAFVDLTDSVTASLLNAHRNNNNPDEKHLTDQQWYAAMGITGQPAPSSTNHYVTENDTRIPTLNEGAALAGQLDNLTTANPPSGTNKYVVAEFSVAVPTSTPFTGGTGSIYIPATEGPFYVGTGGPTGPTGATNFFKLYDAALPHEYIDNLGNPVVISEVHYGATGSIIDPSANPTILGDNGFYDGPISIWLNAVPATNGLIRYGKKQNFKNMSRGLLLEPQPNTQTSQETMYRIETISGRLFTDPTPAIESNLFLRTSINSLRLYLDSEENPDFVVPGDDYPRLRNIPEIAGYYPKTLIPSTITPMYTGVSYTIQPNPNDPDKTSLLQLFSTGIVSNNTIPPGATFIDSAGTKFRILQQTVSAGNVYLAIYTRNKTVAPCVVGATPLNCVYLDYNPREVEILSDFRAEFQEYIPITGVKDAGFEELPPGGSNPTVNGAGFNTLISSDSLAYYGSTGGLEEGRKVYSILPLENSGFADPRVRLVGDWRLQEESGFVMSDSGYCAIEFTGRGSVLSVLADFNATGLVPKVFINGVYSSILSVAMTTFPATETLTGYGQVTSGATPSYKKAPHNFFLFKDPRWQGWGTIRIEFDNSTNLFYSVLLFGLEVTSATPAKTINEENGKGFLGTDFITPSSNQLPIMPTVIQPQKVARFIDRTTKTRSATATLSPYISSTTTNVTSGSSTFTSTDLANQGAKIGDVFLFTTLMDRYDAGADTTQYRYAQITQFTAPNTFTLSSPLNFNLVAGLGRIELVFRVPVSTAPGAIPAAPSSPTSKEYLRLKVKDWNTKNTNDICNLTYVGTPDNHFTTLSDGITSCVAVGSNMYDYYTAGYEQAIVIPSIGAINISGWGTRFDLVICSKTGPYTLNIQVDGFFTYTVSGKGITEERISLFYDAQPQSHSVGIVATSGTPLIGEWIFHDLVSPEITGLPVYEYQPLRNSFPGAVGAYQYDFAPTGFISASPSTSSRTSFAGVRVFDPMQINARFINPSNTFGPYWIIRTPTNDDTLRKRFGRVVETNALGAKVEITFIGEYFELYYEAGMDKGIYTFTLDGTTLTSANFPTIRSFGALDLAFGTLDGISGYSALDNTRRSVLTGVPAYQGQYKHTLLITITGKNGSSSNYFLSLVACADNPISYLPWNRAGTVNFSSIKDTRPFQFQALTQKSTGLATQMTTAFGFNALASESGNEEIQGYPGDNTAFGSGALENLSNGSQNTAVGQESLNASLSGTTNTAIGYRSLFTALSNCSTNTAVGGQSGYGVVTGSANVFIGYRSGPQAANSTAVQSIGIGQNSLYWGGYCNNNIAIGYSCLQGTLDASSAYNIVIGNNALSGAYPLQNVVIGHQALSSGASNLNWNTAIGYQALHASITSFNCAIGRQALYENSSGETNIAIGDCAGYHNNGFNNVFIGRDSGYGFSTNTSTNNVGIGRGTFNFAPSATIQSVAIGTGALAQGSIKSVAVGHSALANATATNAAGLVAIGNQALRFATDAGTGSIAIGDQAAYNSNPGAGMDGNIYIGWQSGYGATGATGASNIGVGTKTLYSMVSGRANTAVGNYAQFNATTGQYNVSVGDYTLYQNQTGLSNVAIGTQALRNNTTDNNVAIGYQSQLLTSTGTYNTSVGALSLSSNITGFSNTAIGYGTLYATSTTHYNTAVGVSALSYNIGQYNTAVGANCMQGNSNFAGSDNVAVGAAALFNIGSGSFNVAIGHTALYNNATGTFNNAVGNNALYTNILGTNNCAFGESALYYSTSSTNSAFGNSSLYRNGTGAGNNGFGYQALYNNTVGNYNCAFGNVALNQNTSGFENNAFGVGALLQNNGNLNNAFGYYALAANTGGVSNNAFGFHALTTNASGNSNSAFGDNALALSNANGNSAFGSYALTATTSGTYNSAVGAGALQMNTTGLGNTAMGSSTLGATVAGILNTAVGWGAGPSGDWSNSASIGANAMAGGSNQMRLGDNATTVHAQVALVVDSDQSLKEQIEISDLGLNFISKLNPRKYKYKNYTRPEQTILQVIKQPSLDDNGMVIETEETITTVIPAQTYTYERPHYGLIAQEVKSVMEALNIDFAGYVDSAVDGGIDLKGLRYEEFISPLIKAVQEQQEVINSLKDRISSLEEKATNPA